MNLKSYTALHATVAGRPSSIAMTIVLGMTAAQRKKIRNLPRLVRDKRDGSIELIDYDNAAEWRGDLERKPSLYQWLPINGNTL